MDEQVCLNPNWVAGHEQSVILSWLDQENTRGVWIPPLLIHDNPDNVLPDPIKKIHKEVLNLFPLLETKPP